jgi:hypothetical protein
MSTETGSSLRPSAPNRDAVNSSTSPARGQALSDIRPRARSFLARLLPTHEGTGPASGTSLHVAGELLRMMAGVDMIHVPYHGSTGFISSR